MPSKNSSNEPFKLIVVLGPTASGKTDLSVELAKHFDTEIISFDSLQVYKHMDIGTAKPSKELRQRVPHHLIDVMEPDQEFTAGHFRKEALSIIDNLKKSKRFAILVGGTGFYLQALLRGMYDVDKTDPAIKEAMQLKFESDGREASFANLQTLDPEYASSIHINDTYRVLRGMEIWEQFGIKPSQLKETFKADPLDIPVIQVGLDKPKELLAQTIEKRTERMISQGLVEEVSGLLKSYKVAPKPLSSVGYKETVDVIQGRLELSLLAETISKNTLSLVKRQRTWFKRDKSVHWFYEKPSIEAIESLTKVRLH